MDGTSEVRQETGRPSEQAHRAAGRWYPTPVTAPAFLLWPVGSTAVTEASSLFPPRLVVRGQVVDLTRPVLMVTADRVDEAVQAVDRGAAIVEVSGSPDEDGPEVVSTVRSIRAARPEALVAVGATAGPATVRAALWAGAAIVAAAGGRLDPAIVELCVEFGVGAVVGDGTPGGLAALERRGLPREAVILDPGSALDDLVRHVDRMEHGQGPGRPVVLALDTPGLLAELGVSDPIGDGGGGGGDGDLRTVGLLAAVGRLARPGTILRIGADAVDAVADYLAVAAVLAGHVELPPDAQLAPHLRREPSPPPRQ
jgi:hypothetical protein